MQGTSCNKTGQWPTLFLTFPLLCGDHFITLHYSTLLGTFFLTLLYMCALYGGRWCSLCHASFVASSLSGCADLIMTFSVCGNCCHAILYPVGVFHDMCCMHSVLLLYADRATLCVPYSTLPYSLLLGCGHTLPVVLCVDSLLYTTLFLTAVILYLYANVAIALYVYSLYSIYIMWSMWAVV